MTIFLPRHTRTSTCLRYGTSGNRNNGRLTVSNYKYILIDEFGGACRKFASKMEATPYMTAGMVLKALPRLPKSNPYQVALTLLPEALF